MAEIKNLYSATALEAAQELLWRTHAWRPDPNFVQFALVNLDDTTARLDIQAKLASDDGRPGFGRGITRFTYRKADLARLFPNDVVFDRPLNSTFEQVRQFFLLSYSFLLEDDEFEVVGQEVDGPFGTGSVLNAVPDGDGRIYLRVTPNSLRWKAGDTIALLKI